MLKVKHAMFAWLFILAFLFIAIVVVAPLALMFTGGTPQVRDIGNYLLLFVVALPIGIIVCTVVGAITFPIAVLLCATDRPAAVGCPTCGYDLDGNLTGVCPECGADIECEIPADTPAAHA